MPDNLLRMVGTGESGLFKHLAEDEISILSNTLEKIQKLWIWSRNLAVHGKSVGDCQGKQPRLDSEG